MVSGSVRRVGRRDVAASSPGSAITTASDDRPSSCSMIAYEGTTPSTMDEGAPLGGGISQGSAGVHRSPRISENTEAGLLSISRMCSNFVATGGRCPANIGVGLEHFVRYS